MWTSKHGGDGNGFNSAKPSSRMGTRGWRSSIEAMNTQIVEDRKCQAKSVVYRGQACSVGGSNLATLIGRPPASPPHELDPSFSSQLHFSIELL